ncbi:MAG: hypothetical protein IID15_09185 [Candidatus Marinimicrobia bacterium]|nr:hypothetical protein [Candidatus Neomarinimicrobiota bacterium]
MTQASFAAHTDAYHAEQERWHRRTLRNRVGLFLVCFLGAGLSMLILAL